MSSKITPFMRATFALGLWASLALPACVGTPLPDPPSFANALVTGTPTPQLDTTRLVGGVHAVRPGSSTIRITTPPSAGVLVAVNADGTFGRIVPGTIGETFYVEMVEADTDVFLGAFVVLADGSVAPASAGPDTDGDGSPDAIDCAVNDATQAGRRCVACASDSDCATGQVCTAGACRLASGCVPTAEVCNGLDDDCNTLVDDGEPNAGVACFISPGNCGVLTCAGAPMCMMRPHVDHETCGNGIDDDCNGLVDDGCP